RRGRRGADSERTGLDDARQTRRREHDRGGGDGDVVHGAGERGAGDDGRDPGSSAGRSVRGVRGQRADDGWRGGIRQLQGHGRVERTGQLRGERFTPPYASARRPRGSIVSGNYTDDAKENA